MKRKNILQTLSMFMTVMFLSGSTSVYAAENTLTVGVRGDIMNFGYYNETTGKFYGMEIDLAYELAERLGFEGEDHRHTDRSECRTDSCRQIV